MEDYNQNENNAEQPKENAPASGDEYVIGEGFVVDESAIDLPKEAPKKKKKKKKGVGSAVFQICLILVISGIFAAGIVLLGAEYLGIGPGRGQEVVVEVPEGATTAQIADMLKEVHAINSRWMFRIYSKLKKYDGQYQYGVYTFSNELGYEDLTEILRTEGAVAKSVRVTVPERATIDEISELMEKNGVCSKKDFINALDSDRYKYDFVDDIPVESVYYRLEGYLFPDTYDFYCYDPEVCAELAVDKMLARMNQALTADIRKAAEDRKYTIHQLLTMASIVELEASGQPDEMKNVAQVFYNRLTEWENPLLGSSPTAKYKYGRGRYDTNKNPGLPPGPYCCPSMKAIEAAAHPNTENKATYFVTDASMKFYYTYSLEEHNRTISRLKAEHNWIYESYD